MFLKVVTYTKPTPFSAGLEEATGSPAFIHGAKLTSMKCCFGLLESFSLDYNAYD